MKIKKKEIYDVMRDGIIRLQAWKQGVDKI